MLKKISIFGTGGHGWICLEDFLNNSDNQQNFDNEIFLTSVDWGGSSGLFSRMLEHNNQELNLELHNRNLPVLPWGDWNKIIIYFINQKIASGVGDVLDLRSNKWSEIEEGIEIITENLGFEDIIIQDFVLYVKTAYNYFLNNKYSINYNPKPLCLGYFLHNFLFWHLESIVKLNKYYRIKNIIPTNLNLDFISRNRQVLVGKTESGVFLKGEDVIDVSNEVILPESLNTQEVDGSEGAVEDEFIRDLRLSHLIVIPPGSINNWLPIVNKPNVAEILKAKANLGKLVLIVNLVHKKCEYDIDIYLKYLKNLGIEPIVLAPKKLPISGKQYILDSQRWNLSNEDEVQRFELSSNKIQRCLETISENHWQYKPHSVTESLKKILTG